MPGSENFSFSGLKTAVRYLLPKIGVIPSGVEESRGIIKDEFQRGPSTSPAYAGFARDDKLLSDLCASFQQAIIDVLVTKTIAAAQKYGMDLVTISGGVSCNQELRRQMRDASSRKGIEFKSAEPWLCTDNAAMIAFAALLRLRAGFESHVTEEIDPNLKVA
jgi:N6-L-threonylcarbamoyladenine synthase